MSGECEYFFSCQEDVEKCGESSDYGSDGGGVQEIRGFVGEFCKYRFDSPDDTCEKYCCYTQLFCVHGRGEESVA